MALPPSPRLGIFSDALEGFAQPGINIPPPPGLGTYSNALTFLAQPDFYIPPPPGLGTNSDAIAVPPQREFDGTMADVDKLLGSLKLRLSEKSQEFLLRSDKCDSLVCHDCLVEDTKLTPSPRSTVSALSDESTFDYPSFLTCASQTEHESLISPRSESQSLSTTTPITVPEKSPVYASPCILGEQPIVPTHVLDSLQKLQEMAAGLPKMNHEDVMTHELHEQVCAALPLYKRLYSPYIPIDDEGNVTSLGSILHAEGTCKPCAFQKRNRCHKKEMCLYCHYDDHDITSSGPSRQRQSKVKRMRNRRAKQGQQKQQSGDILRFSL
eukprot:gnl/MRDRNA2_/MRDRNA2_103992_c0_seq1.p1 gnl/MRDRNA2_/MRDRNA2_103992_c0~~gnl/MRDRNA2_/MRDRNA2_103992_c0_seq1.p1  ORF type:complete len:325 (+),score=53.71 gnl/MRDRNA2_/MRDRNA2_103992_c0_seq1:95-1069(+)